MQLRDHPLMTRKSGGEAWPPHWTTTLRDPTDNPHGEIGTLEQALMHVLVDNKIFLFIQFQGLRYMGFMGFDDPKFCSAMYVLLQSNIGHSIKEIGDLDVSFTL
jgi:hypothetical protein